MIRRPALAFPVAALASIGAACSSSSVTDPSAAGRPLSASEAGAVAASFVAQASSVAAGHVNGTVNSDGSITAQCPDGGTITSALMLGDFTTNGDGSRDYLMGARITPQACVVGTGTRQIAITGDPSLLFNLSFTASGTTLLSSRSMVTGGFKWDGGSCKVDYTATTTLNGSKQTTTTVGTVCGQHINTTATF